MAERLEYLHVQYETVGIWGALWTPIFASTAYFQIPNSNSMKPVWEKFKLIVRRQTVNVEIVVQHEQSPK